jgi:hypothetical protein
MSYDDKAHYLAETLIKNRLDALLRPICEFNLSVAVSPT